jgi:hypothetical protein
MLVKNNESRLFFDRFSEDVIKAVERNDFHFIEGCVDEHCDLMTIIASENALLKRAFHSKAVKTFQIIINGLEFPTK